jgi:hypothetical protein
MMLTLMEFNPAKVKVRLCLMRRILGECEAQGETETQA